MRVCRFDPTEDLIVVEARVYGRRGFRPLTLALDTAASQTHIVPEVRSHEGRICVDRITPLVYAGEGRSDHWLFVQRADR